MTPERERELLSEALNETKPVLRDYITPVCDITTGNWDLTAFSFSHGFEAMWDAARSKGSNGLLNRPLLMMWRHSVELSLKAALNQLIAHTKGEAPKQNHGLEDLVDEIIKNLAKLGENTACDLAHQVKEIVAYVGSIDPKADRFRYPFGKNGATYSSFNIDLVQLYQAHWLVTAWADGISVEYETR